MRERSNFWRELRFKRLEDLVDIFCLGILGQ